MRIAYITALNPYSIISWSGTIYFMAQSLKDQSFQIDYLSAYNAKNNQILWLKQQWYKWLFKQRYLTDRVPLILRDNTKKLKNNLLHNNSDIVFSPGTLPIAYLECKQPIVFWTDATFGGIVDYYPEFSNLCKESLECGHAIEISALSRSKLVLYSSEWAAQSAISLYQTESSKIKVVPFGANLPCDRSIEDIKKIVDSKPSDKCKLLFIGVDWQRKGGDVALEVAIALNKMGLKTELTIVGCRPAIREKLPDYVRVLGFINKTSAEGLKQIIKLWVESHLLILPSRAECYGVVFCEANSFGVPCLATNTGGIPTIIKNDINGMLFETNATTDIYCNYINGLFSRFNKYKQMALSSFAEYQNRLNWKVAGEKVKKLLLELER